MRIGWLGLGLWMGVTVSVAKAAERPNLVLLVTDDQRADCLGCAGHPLLKTPNIDRLARQGTRFRNAFVTTSICAVSRASIMTGRYARHHGVGDFRTPLPPDVLRTSLPALLHRAGYRTACFGKWGIGGRAPTELFDVWNAWGGQGKYFHVVDGRRIHNAEFLAREAVGFLKTCRRDQPFCLIVYYKSPHDPFEPDPRDRHVFENITVPRPKTYTPRHFAAMPEFIRKSEGRIRLERRHPTAEAYQHFVKQYLRCLVAVDRSVGKILAALESLGMMDQTAIVYSSDNGFFLGEHGLSGKWLMHEESIRVPLIIRPPAGSQYARGRTVPQLVLNIDIAPTLLDFASVPVPEGMDGRSLRPWVEGKSPDWRKHFFYEHHYHHGGRIPRTEGVRTDRWKYITYYDVEPKYEELYDLKSDPFEEKNLIRDPVSAEALARLRRIYRQYVDRLPPPVLPRRRPLKRR